MGLDRARVCFGGGAALPLDVLEFFAGLGIVIHEAYGLSETAGTATMNRAGSTRFGSVGLPVPGVEVRLADDHEVLVRGQNVFSGYEGEQEATEEALRDGWLHTGDLGRRDDDGFLYLTGRKKAIIVTSGGKNVSPGHIESSLMRSPAVDCAIVCGDGRPYLTALCTVPPEYAARFPDRAMLERAVFAEVVAATRHLSRAEQIRRITVLDRKLTVEAGELTPTLKVRRATVLERFAGEIEAMYAGRSR